MRARKIYNDNFVWFNKKFEGYDENQNPILTSDESSYSEGIDGVIDSLKTRLSTLKGEVWYSVNYGIPLTDKIRSKGIMDSNVYSIIMGHPDVIEIQEFKSSLDKNNYQCSFTIVTIYGEANISM